MIRTAEERALEKLRQAGFDIGSTPVEERAREKFLDNIREARIAELEEKLRLSQQERGDERRALWFGLGCLIGGFAFGFLVCLVTR